MDIYKLFGKDVFKPLNIFNIEIKYIKKEHLKVYSNLELIKGHNNPNDRIIISQAICEDIPLISSDKKLELYKKHGLDLVFNKI